MLLGFSPRQRLRLINLRAVVNATPNHAFEGTACQRGCASLRPAVAAPQRRR
jgi:hypothetical protein